MKTVKKIGLAIMIFLFSPINFFLIGKKVFAKWLSGGAEAAKKEWGYQKQYLAVYKQVFKNWDNDEWWES